MPSAAGMGAVVLAATAAAAAAAPRCCCGVGGKDCERAAPPLLPLRWRLCDCWGCASAAVLPCPDTGRRGSCWPTTRAGWRSLLQNSSAFCASELCSETDTLLQTRLAMTEGATEGSASAIASMSVCSHCLVAFVMPPMQSKLRMVS